MRPLSEEEREVRRADLADLAAAFVAEVGYGRLTVDAVAKAAGVSKGTVFLAFASKEDLVLNAAARRYDLWFDRMEALDPGLDPAALAQDLLASLRADPLLLPLVALVGPVLEQGCSEGAVVAFKEGLARRMATLAQIWGPRRPGVPADRWASLFPRVHAVTVGAWAVGETSAVVRGAVANRPDLGWMLTGFDALYPALVAAQLRDMLGP